jgi:hydroxycarboxylate dehydrogenase B
MPTFTSSQLKQIACEIFVAAGAENSEARIVADALVRSNEAGHDSHGVLRIPEYTGWMEQKLIVAGARIRIRKETEAFALIDGGWGFGQVVAREAMKVAIDKASRVGVGTVSVSRCCHIGRVGDYPHMAAEAGMAAVMFVNTHGGGKLVAPWGGRERRLAANPISVAIPRTGSWPLLMDISTSSIAEGKVRGMLNRKMPVPPGHIIDARGEATTRPEDFYGPPPGALLPFGGHKGFALGMVTDILAGALSGAGCSRAGADRVGNSFLAFVIDINSFCDRQAFDAEVEQLIEYVKSSDRVSGFSEILVPGEPEAREQEARAKNGIMIDDETWRQIAEVSRRYGVLIPQS